MNDKSSLLHQLRLDRAPEPQSSDRRRWWLFGVLILVLAAAGGWVWFGGSDGIPIHVATARAATASGPRGGASLLDASGYVVARRQATVSAKVTGKVTEVLIEEGQAVKAGDVIARLDDSNTKAALLEAKAQVSQAEASLAAARIAFADAQPNFERQQRLLQQGWVSKEAFDTYKASYDATRTSLMVAEQSVAVGKAGLEVAQRNQDDTVIQAPWNGLVTVKAAQPGEIVSPFATGGTTRTGIGTIVDMDSLEAEIDVSENFIHRVHPGQEAVVKLNAYPDWSIPASVIAVIPTADRAKATVKVRVGFKIKDPRILPEMGARVSFLGDQVAGPATAEPVGVIVPASGVQASGDTGTAYVVRDSRVEHRSVRLGARNGSELAVLSGLAVGEKIAIDGLDKLKDGSQIRIED